MTTPPRRGIIRESALPRRKGIKEGRSAQEECLVLSDTERGASGRPVHEFDSHLSVVRRQLLRLSDRVAAPRPETGDQPPRMDAVELSRNLGADRLSMKQPKKDPVREDRIHNEAT